MQIMQIICSLIIGKSPPIGATNTAEVKEVLPVSDASKPQDNT